MSPQFPITKSKQTMNLKVAATAAAVVAAAVVAAVGVAAAAIA